MTTRTRTAVALLSACGLLFVTRTAAAQNREALEQKAWVTTTDGQELKGTLTSFTNATVQLRIQDGRTWTIPLREVSRIDVPDGLGNGARNGALAGGLMIGVPMVLSVGLTCGGGRQCKGMTPFLIAGLGYSAALGAGIGVFCDAVRIRRQPIYSASGTTSSVRISPMVSPKGAGVSVSLQWPRR